MFVNCSAGRHFWGGWSAVVVGFRPTGVYENRCVICKATKHKAPCAYMPPALIPTERGESGR